MSIVEKTNTHSPLIQENPSVTDLYLVMHFYDISSFQISVYMEFNRLSPKSPLPTFTEAYAEAVPTNGVDRFEGVSSCELTLGVSDHNSLDMISSP